MARNAIEWSKKKYSLWNPGIWPMYIRIGFDLMLLKLGLKKQSQTGVGIE